MKQIYIIDIMKKDSWILRVYGGRVFQEGLPIFLGKSNFRPGNIFVHVAKFCLHQPNFVYVCIFLSDKTKFCPQNCHPLSFWTNLLEGTNDEKTCTDCTFFSVYVERDGWKRCDLWENVILWTFFPKSKTLTENNYSKVWDFDCGHFFQFFPESYIDKNVS